MLDDRKPLAFIFLSFRASLTSHCWKALKGHLVLLLKFKSSVHTLVYAGRFPSALREAVWRSNRFGSVVTRVNERNPGPSANCPVCQHPEHLPRQLSVAEHELVQALSRNLGGIVWQVPHDAGRRERNAGSTAERVSLSAHCCLKPLDLLRPGRRLWQWPPIQWARLHEQFSALRESAHR